VQKPGKIDSRMDAALILYDGCRKGNYNGTVVGGLPRFRGRRRNGEYHLKVYDFLFRGGGEYFYDWPSAPGPHIDFIFPPSGLAGTKGKYLL